MIPLFKWWIVVPLIVLLSPIGKANVDYVTPEERKYYTRLLDEGGYFLSIVDLDLRFPQPQIYVHILDNGSLEFTSWPKGAVFKRSVYGQGEIIEEEDDDDDPEVLITDRSNQWSLCVDGGRPVLIRQNKTRNSNYRCFWKKYNGERGVDFPYGPILSPVARLDFGNITAHFQSVGIRLTMEIDKYSPKTPYCKVMSYKLDYLYFIPIHKSDEFLRLLRMMATFAFADVNNTQFLVGEFMQNISELARNRHLMKMKEWDLEGLQWCRAPVFFGMNGTRYDISTPLHKFSFLFSLRESRAQLELKEIGLLSKIMLRIVSLTKKVFYGYPNVVNFLTYLGFDLQDAIKFDQDLHLIDRFPPNLTAGLKAYEAKRLLLEEYAVRGNRKDINLNCFEEDYHTLPGRKNVDIIW